MMNPRGKAMSFAIRKHNGQKDDAGQDYFKGHVMQVFQLIEMVTKDEEIQAAAVLHDTLEDTDTTYEELEREFGKRIADLVLELTHEGSKEKGYYLPRLHSKDAILIKYADRLSNLSRMQAWDAKRQAQYLRKSKFWKTGDETQ